MSQLPEGIDPSVGERRAGGPGDLPADMAPWMAFVIRTIDTLSHWIGYAVCLLVIPLMITMVWEVIGRSFFRPTTWAWDMSSMLCGAMWMLGAAYGLVKGVHIRSDFLYRDWPVRRQAIVDALLYIVLFFPTMLLFLYVSYGYAYNSVITGERSADTAWMPYLGPIKTAIPVGVVFLILQGVSELLKSFYAARTGRWPHQGAAP